MWTASFQPTTAKRRLLILITAAIRSLSARGVFLSSVSITVLFRFDCKPCASVCHHFSSSPVSTIVSPDCVHVPCVKPEIHLSVCTFPLHFIVSVRSLVTHLCCYVLSLVFLCSLFLFCFAVVLPGFDLCLFHRF